jgi:hypothetical protein
MTLFHRLIESAITGRKFDYQILAIEILWYLVRTLEVTQCSDHSVFTDSNSLCTLNLGCLVCDHYFSGSRWYPWILFGIVDSAQQYFLYFSKFSFQLYLNRPDNLMWIIASIFLTPQLLWITLTSISKFDKILAIILNFLTWSPTAQSLAKQRAS